MQLFLPGQVLIVGTTQPPGIVLIAVVLNWIIVPVVSTKVACVWAVNSMRWHSVDIVQLTENSKRFSVDTPFVAPGHAMLDCEILVPHDRIELPSSDYKTDVLPFN